MTDLRVSVGERSGDGKRAVVYRCGEREYPDQVDISNGWQREQSLKRACEALELPADNLPALGTEVVRLAAEADKKAAKDHIEFRRISCAELDAATYTLEYLIDGVLVAGQPCILAGGKKCLKTSLLIDLGIAPCDGRLLPWPAEGQPGGPRRAL